MKGSSNIVSALHHLKQAQEHFESFKREHPTSKGARLFTNYSQKLTWIYKDLMANPGFTKDVLDGIKEEWESDVFSVDAITEKVALLNPGQREIIENIIDEILKGEVVHVSEYSIY